MAWRIEFSDDADRDFSNLEKSIQRRVFRYLPERVVVAADPRDLGEPLAHDLAGLWHYRVGDYRVLCRMKMRT